MMVPKGRGAGCVHLEQKEEKDQFSVHLQQATNGFKLSTSKLLCPCSKLLNL